MRLAVIGGTGVSAADLFTTYRDVRVETPYGFVDVHEATEAGNPVWFLHRHGRGHVVPPHRINYRANIWALYSLGADGVIATSAVGSLHADLQPGTLVALDSFLDFTSGRESTFFDGDDGRVVHTDMTYPYCPTLRQAAIAAAQELGVNLRPHGCYVCTNGPRYETAAEIRAFALLGGDVVGMTGVPEVVLARELGLCYTGVALVTNLGAGLTSDVLTHDSVVEVMRAGSKQLVSLVKAVISACANTGCPQRQISS